MPLWPPHTQTGLRLFNNGLTNVPRRRQPTRKNMPGPTWLAGTLNMVAMRFIRSYGKMHEW